MCNCNGNSCSTSGGGSSCQSKGCSCSCHQSVCGCGCHSQSKKSGCDYAEKFLELADQAWMEVLKEKMKDQIRNSAKNMDELARLVTEANHQRWQKKMENKECAGGYEEKLKNFFHQCCPNKK